MKHSYVMCNFALLGVRFPTSEVDAKFKRVDKRTLKIDELPDLSGYSIVNRCFCDWRSDMVKKSSPVYVKGDILYLEKDDEENHSSIWTLDLRSKEFELFVDDLKLFNSQLLTTSIPINGEYVPVVKHDYFCLLHTRTKALEKVKYRGKWIKEVPAATIQGNDVFFCCTEKQVIGNDDCGDWLALCHYNIENGTTTILERDSQLGNCYTGGYRYTGLTWEGSGLTMCAEKIIVISASEIFELEANDDKICRSKKISVKHDLYPQYLINNLAFLRTINLRGKEELYVFDLETHEMNLLCKYDNLTDFNAIGNYLFVNIDYSTRVRISLLPPYEKLEI